MKRQPVLKALCAALLLALAPAGAYADQAANAAIAQPAASPAQQQLAELGERYWDATARYEPMRATAMGDSRYDDQLGISIAPAVREQQYALLRQFLVRLRAIDRAALDRRGQVNYDVMEDELLHALTFEKFPEHLLPVTHMGSLPVMLAIYGSGQGSQPLTSVKEYRAYLSRLNQLPAWIDQAIANLREGMRTGVVHPRPIVSAMLPQFRRLTSATPEASAYYAPVKNMPAAFSDADKAALSADYRAAVAKAMPALARLSAFLEKDYLKAARTSTGWSALPGGREWYAAHVANETTTALTPEQVHQIGLSEVARIQSEYAKVGPRMGYRGPAAGLPKWVGKQAKYHPYKTDTAIVEDFRKLDGVLRERLPKLFDLMPKAPLDVRLEPEISRATASDHYTSPSADGTRPGIFWSVVNDPKAYNRTGMTTLFLHEGQPGHHFQIALLQELNLPDFRKYGGNNAFVEGWALYAETLGKEMGLFEEPDQYFGHLNDEMLRAVRLVVDTGMHAKGWTREKAIRYVMDTIGYPEAEARSQIERYMVWPGQALGYKIGALKIAELRARATEALGPKFSLPAFHRVVLDDGTLPLSLLEAKVDRWIADSK